jgi:hypothetical protein
MLAAINFVIALVSIFVRVGCAATLWNWFAAPIFNLPFLTGIQIYVIGLVVGSFRGIKITSEDLDRSSEEGQKLVFVNLTLNTIYAVVLLILGAIAKAFI